jgi:hypothetical protein
MRTEVRSQPSKTSLAKGGKTEVRFPLPEPVPILSGGEGKGEGTPNISGYCIAMHPESAGDEEVVLAHLNEIKRTIDFKNKYNIPASEDIILYFLLHQVWNELKAKELMSEDRRQKSEVRGQSDPACGTDDCLLAGGGL